MKDGVTWWGGGWGDTANDALDQAIVASRSARWVAVRAALSRRAIDDVRELAAFDGMARSPFRRANEPSDVQSPEPVPLPPTWRCCGQVLRVAEHSRCPTCEVWAEWSEQAEKLRVGRYEGPSWQRRPAEPEPEAEPPPRKNPAAWWWDSWWEEQLARRAEARRMRAEALQRAWEYSVAMDEENAL